MAVSWWENKCYRWRNRLLNHRITFNTPKLEWYGQRHVNCMFVLSQSIPVPTSGKIAPQHLGFAIEDCLASDICEDMAPSLLPREIGDTIWIGLRQDGWNEYQPKKYVFLFSNCLASYMSNCIYLLWWKEDVTSSRVWECWFHLQNEIQTRWGDSKNEISFDVHHIYEHIDVKDWKNETNHGGKVPKPEKRD